MSQRHSPKNKSRLAPVLLLGIFGGLGGQACTLVENGTTFTGSNIGRLVGLEGFAQHGNETMQVQVLNPANQDPGPGATWTTIGTTQSQGTASNYQGTDLYYWNVSVTPVPNAGANDRWRAGGLARFRVLTGTGTPTTTFDDTGCWQKGYSEGWTVAEIQAACESHNSPVLTFVDKDPVPPSAATYLSLRNTPGEGDDYALQIAAPQTLNDYKTSRGFPTGEVVAKYYNAGDLGLGREMHCRKNTGGGPNDPDTSCYVTNYGSPNDGLNDATSALADAISGHAPYATVAMDHYPSGPNQVRFYTYGSNGDLVLLKATLDSEGEKDLPGLCLSCHGGTYDAGLNRITGARFLPFDLNAFRFADSGSYTRSAQQEAFRKLNKMVYETAPGSSITSLISGWYGGVAGLATVGQVQNSDWVPPGYAGQEVVYKKAIAPYCRTCHVALSVQMDTFAQLQALNPLGAVCNTKYMPHAEMTRKSFWASSARAHLAGALGWATHCN